MDAYISRVFAVYKLKATDLKTLSKHGYGHKSCTTLLNYVNEVSSMNGKLKDLKTFKLVYPRIIAEHFDCPDVEPKSGVHGNSKGENATECRPLSTY